MNIEELKKQYDCLIFDCDGTLADTMEAHCMAYKEAFNYYNIPFTKGEFYKYAPRGGIILLNSLITNKNYDKKYIELIKTMKSEIVGDFLDEYMIPNTELVNLIKNHHLNFEMVVVSNGRRTSICTILNKLKIIQYFRKIFTAEDYIASKPYPEPYVLAYRSINAKPSKCLVFEDNENGRISAENAGLKVKMIEVIK